MSANVQEQAIYRCIGAACGRALPRRVNFCPYCGTPQHAGAAQAAARVAPEVEAAAAAPAVVLHKTAAPAAAPDVEWGDAPRAAAPDVECVNAPRAANAGAADKVPPAAAAPARPARAAPVPARPPEREPVRLRWWLLALALLWMIWTLERPAPKKIEARIDRAIALATECKAREAQSELIALRSANATPAQLERLQQALNDAAAECTRSRRRAR